MSFFDAFVTMGYSAWNLLATFVFLGVMLGVILRVNRRSRAVQAAYLGVLVVGFVASVLALAPLIEEVRRVNVDWRERQAADPRLEAQRAQTRAPAQPEPEPGERVPRQPATNGAD